MHPSRPSSPISGSTPRVAARWLDGAGQRGLDPRVPAQRNTPTGAQRPGKTIACRMFHRVQCCDRYRCTPERREPGARGTGPLGQRGPPVSASSPLVPPCLHGCTGSGPPMTDPESPVIEQPVLTVMWRGNRVQIFADGSLGSALVRTPQQRHVAFGSIAMAIDGAASVEEDPRRAPACRGRHARRPSVDRGRRAPDPPAAPRGELSRPPARSGQLSDSWAASCEVHMGSVIG